ncbi:MAG: hypothetical protein E7381_03035 [Clostridiales bacterium]|nr:hypothetical protein [Clostridiales bacterium]
MQNKRRAIYQKLKRPKGWFLTAVYLLTVAFIVGACTLLFVDYTGTPLAILAYTLFALSAIFLAYTTYTVVLFFPQWKNAVAQKLRTNKYTRELMENYGFRTVFFAVCSFIFNILYGLFYGVLGILERSIWFGALAGYYVILSFIKGGILLHHKRKRNRANESLLFAQTKTYRTCGVLLIVINLALSGAIAQMIFKGETFQYEGLLIYASSAYAFFKITMAIYNLFRAKKEDDLTIQAIRNVNLTNATVSLLALQTALLSTFAEEGVNASLFNTITGILVSALTYAIGIYMTVHGTKRIKRLRLENTNER